MVQTLSRRHYKPGTCQDCGNHKRVTVIRFWVNYMRYVVCAECIKCYRPVILKKQSAEDR